MVPTSHPSTLTSEERQDIQQKKCNKICLKQLYILVNEKQ